MKLRGDTPAYKPDAGDGPQPRVIRGSGAEEMNIIGTELVHDELRQPGYFFKAVLNGSGVAFFPGKSEHRTVKIAGLSYEDDYKGNALAAIITNGRIEIRYHRDFSIGRVTTIMQALLEHPDLTCLKAFSVQYRGDRIR